MPKFHSAIYPHLNITQTVVGVYIRELYANVVARGHHIRMSRVGKLRRCPSSRDTHQSDRVALYLYTLGEAIRQTAKNQKINELSRQSPSVGMCVYINMQAIAMLAYSSERGDLLYTMRDTRIIAPNDWSVYLASCGGPLIYRDISSHAV